MNNTDAWFIDSMMKTTLEGTNPDQSNEFRQALLNFLEVLDSLDRLIKVAYVAEKSPETSSPSRPEQFQILRKQLLNAFEQTGVTFLSCVGLPFDPVKHEAVDVVYHGDIDDNIIVEEISCGCHWHGELLRFARVVVTRKN